ncbi:MAG: transglutaminase domain-containing protein, partial [Acidobacteriota bacterium]
LPSDWDAPFAFVQAAIRYVPYIGSVRGVAGTLESGGGNALDQALLLRELLEARGLSTRLVRGELQWADAARLVTGSVSPAPPQPEDPWPRWLEAAADHWWVQALRDDEWIDLDPSFADVAPGEAVGRNGRPQDSVPEELETVARVELLRGDLLVADETLRAEEVIGQTVGLSVVAQSEQAVALWRATEQEIAQQGAWLRRAAEELGVLPVTSRGGAAGDVSGGGAAATGPRVRVPPRLSHPSRVERLFLDPHAGPWQARLELPGRSLSAGPFERVDLDDLRIRITIVAPQAAPHVLQVPWGGGDAGRLSIVVTVGAVSDERLARHARTMYRALDRLAVVEQAALVDMRPPIDYWNAVETLSAVTRREWNEFAVEAPQALGWALLRGVERVSAASPAGRVIRPGLRMVAVRWHPPDADREAAFDVLMSDPITVGVLAEGSSVAPLRAASGLLQSAVFSQVLNRVTDRAPETAFDATLRAIGTGEGLRVFSTPGELPATWPAAARAEAGIGLDAGYRVIAPPSFGEGTAGWWSVGVFDGETVGWVPGRQSALHGRVSMAASGSLDDLDILLASLPAMHRALRWLSELPGSGPTSLSSVPVAACASASVAAEFLADSVPPSWPRPDVAGFCGPG